MQELTDEYSTALTENFITRLKAEVEVERNSTHKAKRLADLRKWQIPIKEKNNAVIESSHRTLH